MALPKNLFAARVNKDGHRVTTMELFFDLVYVFAFTQVTAWIAHEHSWTGTFQGVLVLSILWWTWVAWSWLGNVMSAEHGAPIAGFIISMASIFVIALTIPYLSVVAVGVAAESIEMSPRLLGIGILGVLAAVALWWPYFKDIGPTLEESIEEAEPARKVDIARDSYTYLHLPLVVGIVLAAAGVEEAVLALEDNESSGVAAVLLAGGAALFSATGALLMRLAGGTWHWLAASAGFFVLATLWMPALDAIVAIAITTVVLAVVGFVTPATRNREPLAIESSDRSEGDPSRT